MLIVVLIALALLVAHLKGGKLSRLGHPHLHGLRFLGVAVVLQVVAWKLLASHTNWHPEYFYLASWVCLLAFLFQNTKVKSLRILTLGTILNSIAIAANGGTMPMDRGAAAHAGLRFRSNYWYNSMPLKHPRIPVLGDYWAIPQSWGLLANAFSIGDVLIGIGFSIWMWKTVFDESLDPVEETNTELSDAA